MADVSECLSDKQALAFAAGNLNHSILPQRGVTLLRVHCLCRTGAPLQGNGWRLASITPLSFQHGCVVRRVARDTHTSSTLKSLAA
ncbi:hypothetical protein OH492_19115 [Vibrio chagasii]|nr:hypothetical protein [Vibrio chagasii]